MSLFSACKFMSEIDSQKFVFTSENDILGVDEHSISKLKVGLLPRLNKELKRYITPWEIFDFKYVTENIDNQLKDVILTLEACHSSLRYMRYDVTSNKRLCLDEVQKIDITPEKDPSALANKLVTIVPDMEGMVKVFMYKYRHELPQFDRSVLKSIGVVPNIHDNLEIPSPDYERVSSLCKAIINTYGKLVPFCHLCGRIHHLLRFKEYHIYCEHCFSEKFSRTPIKELPAKKKVLLRDILLTMGEIPYSEYVDYVKLNYPLDAEYHMLDVMNYVRGRKLLSSPKLRDISKTLSKKQNKRIYVLSKFFCQTIIDERGGKDCPSFGEHMHLLIKSKE